MFDLKSVKFRNFLSYGDYDTELALDNAGQCLIIGEVIDGPGDAAETSNGSGKSSMFQAILWCLFGRTMHADRQAGDDVVNWFTKKDCIVELEFKNGDKLTRTRKVDGHSDLLLIKDGHDVSLGTNTMQQKVLNKELGLDWDIFCGSVFFSQFGKPWMEMSDQKRKEAMEREFHLDRIMLYADVAKAKKQKIENEHVLARGQINASQISIDDLQKQIDKLQVLFNGFENNKIEKINAAVEILNGLKSTGIKIYDIDALKTKWDVVKKIMSMVESKRSELYAMKLKVGEVNGKISHFTALINDWVKKDGKICLSCGQQINKQYVESKIQNPKAMIDALNIELAKYESDMSAIENSISEVDRALDGKIPSVTSEQAEKHNKECNARLEQIKNQESVIAKIKAEVNEYGKLIDELNVKLSSNQQKHAQLLDRIRKLDTILEHINYIYSAYSDRRKIKSYMLQEYIPYFNDRLSYYMDRFELDLRIEFTNALTAQSNLWGYNWFSGGERKRFDVAMMFAMFDVHSVMYGRQCNIIVLDEVDGHIDPRASKLFANIIRDDFSGKVDSVFVISQRRDMRGAFPAELKVRRDGRQSHIVY